VLVWQRKHRFQDRLRIDFRIVCFERAVENCIERFLLRGDLNALFECLEKPSFPSRTCSGPVIPSRARNTDAAALIATLADYESF